MGNPLDLDWGPATIELSDSNRRVAAHVLNHSLCRPQDVARTIRFVKARIRWFGRQLPPGFGQLVIFDDRGQAISEKTREQLRLACTDEQSEARFLSEGE